MGKDAESLDDLPLGDRELDDESEETMKENFGPQKKIGWATALKLALVLTVVFLLFANPWVDKVFCFVPGCGKSPMGVMVAKAIFFFAAAVASVKFLG